MACNTITTGSAFLSGTMAFIDCQAQTIGSYGYGALAEPGSPVMATLSILLTIFIALYGLQLLLGQSLSWATAIGAALKIGIVLTLATSWPAWRIIGFDVLMRGPSEVAQVIGLETDIATQPDELASRLQSVDDTIVLMTSYGTGRLTGGVAATNDVGNSFQGIALADQFALGMGRAAYLIGILVPLGIFRLGAGLLLALAPLIAGLLLFGGTTAIFLGWVRGLFFCALGGLLQILLQGIEIALFEPWLQSAIVARQGGVLTPSAPTELFVLSLTLSGTSIGIMLLVMRFAFFSGTLNIPIIAQLGRSLSRGSYDFQPVPLAVIPNELSRAQVTADIVSNSMRRDQLNSTVSPVSNDAERGRGGTNAGAFTSTNLSGRGSEGTDAVKRSSVRQSEAGRLRDRKS